jgi:homopolymeric O-antigen transport system ATP-binding protein
MTYVIRSVGLGKKYLISHKHRERYEALRDVLAATLRGWGKSRVSRRDATRGRGPATEEFWALKALDMEIGQGERIGIIGRNGAGKSTLLKVLSRITEPSSGRLNIRGRVASLLEVGTGFHPELTGRENIFLNGAILGMGRAEIKRKFDQIVDFSEVEKFLDTPVKRYSSGMYVRLAFSVAAHLEPDILIVDEVLAVGDASFQKKCLGKMGDVGRDGRTVLFVSHNMSAVRQLCERGIILDAGSKVFDGPVSKAIEHYQERVLGGVDGGDGNPVMFERPAAGAPAWLRSVALTGHDGLPAQRIEHEHGFSVTLEIEIAETSKDYYSALIAHDAYGNNIFFSTDEDFCEPPIADKPPGPYQYQISIPGRLLKPGTYYLTPMVGLRRKGKLDRRDAALRFEVLDTMSRRGAKQLYRSTAVVAPHIDWVLRPDGDTGGDRRSGT